MSTKNREIHLRDELFEELLNGKQEKTQSSTPNNNFIQKDKNYVPTIVPTDVKKRFEKIGQVIFSIDESRQWLYDVFSIFQEFKRKKNDENPYFYEQKQEQKEEKEVPHKKVGSLFSSIRNFHKQARRIQALTAIGLGVYSIAKSIKQNKNSKAARFTKDIKDLSDPSKTEAALEDITKGWIVPLIKVVASYVALYHLVFMEQLRKTRNSILVQGGILAGQFALSTVGVVAKGVGAGAKLFGGGGKIATNVIRVANNTQTVTTVGGRTISSTKKLASNGVNFEEKAEQINNVLESMTDEDKIQKIISEKIDSKIQNSEIVQVRTKFITKLKEHRIKNAIREEQKVKDTSFIDNQNKFLQDLATSTMEHNVYFSRNETFSVETVDEKTKSKKTSYFHQIPSFFPIYETILAVVNFYFKEIFESVKYLFTNKIFDFLPDFTKEAKEAQVLQIINENKKELKIKSYSTLNEISYQISLENNSLIINDEWLDVQIQESKDIILNITSTNICDTINEYCDIVAEKLNL